MRPAAPLPTSLDLVLDEIARAHLRIPTLEPRGIDVLDVYRLNVGSVKAALAAAYEAGRQSKEA